MPLRPAGKPAVGSQKVAVSDRILRKEAGVRDGGGNGRPTFTGNDHAIYSRPHLRNNAGHRCLAGLHPTCQISRLRTHSQTCPRFQEQRPRGFALTLKEKADPRCLGRNSRV